MLCGLIHYVDIGVFIGVISDYQWVNIGECDNDSEEDEDDDIDLLFEENAEHTVPVRVPGCGNLLGIQAGIVHMCEQFLIGHIEL